MTTEDGGKATTQFKPGKSGNPGGMTKEQRAQIAVVRSAALEHCPQAIRELVELMNSTDPKVKLAACNSILDRGMGKPAQAITGGDEGDAPLQLAGVLKLVKPAEKA